MLALKFISEWVFDKVQDLSLIESPYSYAIVDKNIRRCLTRKFPYAILYTIENDYILILAVMHCHRNPKSWRDRI